MLYPLKFKPIYINTVWGGDRLAEIRNAPESHGTSWNISAHPHADNVVINGPLQGKKLSEVLDEYAEEVLGNKKKNQMLRLSVLDPKESLSIQVHPYDAYARAHENDEGKTEAWYVLEAEPGANLIAGTTVKDIEEMKKVIREDRIEEYIVRHPMEAGDFICIDAGTLHALGAGMLTLEVSQNSDVTYRFYDFHRKDAQGKERELHLEKSYDVVNCAVKCAKTSHPLAEAKVNERVEILDKKEFTVEILDLDGSYTLQLDGTTFYCLTNVSGDCEILCGGERMSLAYTENVLIPAKCPDVQIQGKGRVIISYVK